MPKQNQSPSTKAFSLSLENQELHKKLELLGGTDAAELLGKSSVCCPIRFQKYKLNTILTSSTLSEQT